LRTQINSAVLIKGFLYGIDGDSDRGVLKCVELATGTEKWQAPSVGFGALIVANDKLIILSNKGELMVAPATTDKFKPTSTAQVLGGKCWTAPVLANGKIYCRNARGDVVCVDVSAKSK